MDKDMEVFVLLFNIGVGETSSFVEWKSFSMCLDWSVLFLRFIIAGMATINSFVIWHCDICLFN